MKLFDLTGPVALVTGASRGIGRAIAVALARQGAYVAVNYASNHAAAEAALAQVREAGGDGELLPFDVSDGAASEKAIDDLHARKKGVHIVVANAGIARDGLFVRLRDEDLDATFATNLRGAMNLARPALRLMMRQRFGRVVFLSSIVAEMGNAGQAAYAASKGAVISLAKTLAREYASRAITVNAVTPGFIDTDMTASINEEQRKAIVGITPLGRMGTADEVASAVTYLASNEAGFVTGQGLRVNGGMYM